MFSGLPHACCLGYFFLLYKMRYLLIVCHIFILWGSVKGYNYEEAYFTQKVDHFGFSNTDSFSQRYLINKESFDPKNGSIFFYTGNEGDITMFANNTGFMWEIANEFRAALIFAEHRYYGKSLPYGKANGSRLGFLSSQQALADFANLIFHLKSTIPGAVKTPVVAFGGSYGGMLAAWIRIKYPHLVVGSVASSAPILTFQNLVPCGDFSKIVTQDFVNAGNSCAKIIRRSWDVIRKIGKSEKGASFLTDTFKTCKPIHTTDVSKLVDWIYSVWTYLGMTDYPYPTNFLNPLPANPIVEACKFLTQETVPDEKLIANIFKAASVFSNYTGAINCTDLDSAAASSLGADLWDYQACTEMVEPECNTGITDMFEPSPWNFTAFSDGCWKKWGVRPDANRIFVSYGGENITASSNIIFTNGKLDPWYSGGILKSLSDTLIAIVMDNAAHHLDLRSSNPADPKSVVDARKLIKKWIHRWISNS